jgi:cytochrome P450
VNTNRPTLLQPTRRSRTLDRSFESIQRIGSELIQNKKNVVLAESSTNGSGAVEKQNVQGHDLLSLLIKSNIASDMPESMRMSDSEILSRARLFPCPCSVLCSNSRVIMCILEIPTFLIAGHETTRCVGPTIPHGSHLDMQSTLFFSSTAVSWTLFALCCQPAVQAKLRAELRTCPTDTPTMEQLNTLPYLEAVVREALRLYAPVSSTQRIAVHDAEIPLQKPFTDKRGVLQSTIRYGYSHTNLWCVA